MDWLSQANLRRAIPPMAEDEVIVMPGFIGSTEDGATTTLGHAGSDLIASLVGAAIAANEIWIWTDVDAGKDGAVIRPQGNKKGVLVQTVF